MQVGTYNEMTKVAPVDLELGDDTKKAEVGERMKAAISKRYGQKQVGSDLKVGETVRNWKTKRGFRTCKCGWHVVG